MCGIVGYVGAKEAAPLLLEGLKRLEYRGYDSAGIATLSNGSFEIHRAPGKLGRLIEKLRGRRQSAGRTGIGHTRWATHGRPTEENAHPHSDCSGKIVVVHNGIFENFAERKAELAAAGHRFTSETDTEVFAHEVEANFDGDLFRAVQKATQAADRRVCRRRLLERRAGSPRHGALGAADRARARRRRELGGVRSRSASALDARHRSSSRTATLPRVDAKGVSRRRQRRDRDRPSRPEDPLGRGRRREGRLSPLHVEGNP